MVPIFDLGAAHVSATGLALLADVFAAILLLVLDGEEVDVDIVVPVVATVAEDTPASLTGPPGAMLMMCVPFTWVHMSVPSLPHHHVSGPSVEPESAYAHG